MFAHSHESIELSIGLEHANVFYYMLLARTLTLFATHSARGSLFRQQIGIRGRNSDQKRVSHLVLISAHLVNLR